MTNKEGTLHLQASGRLAIIRPGREPFELTSGDLFRVEVDGMLPATRMEHLWGEGYYSVDGFLLRDGIRARRSVLRIDRCTRKGECPVPDVSGHCYRWQLPGPWWRSSKAFLRQLLSRSGPPSCSL
jgi:hypothetical protein